MRRRAKKILVMLALTGLVAGCGDSGSNSISVSLYGWVGTGTTGQFVDDIGQFQGAQDLRIAVTDPEARVIVDERTVSIADRSATLPEIDGSDRLRMDFELLGAGQPIAVGSTPTFDSQDGGTHLGFRTMVSPINDFAPVGARYVGSDGTQAYGEATLDGRQLPHSGLGRVGHTAIPTESGEILIVGGGRLASSHDPATMPELELAFDDIQLFDPGSGHFTELGGDEGAVEAGVVGQDRLIAGRAFHTVTPIGDDMFIVAGGFGLTGGTTRPQSSIEVIDLNAAPGNRVLPLAGANLESARGLHTATYRPDDGAVVIAGGLGNSDDDVIATVEIIDPDSASVTSTPMSAARVGHAAVLLEDDSRIWLIGGRNTGGVLSTTETVTTGGTQMSIPLNQPRYGASAIHLGANYNQQVMVVGGFTSGGATSSYELGHPERTAAFFDALENVQWQIDQARGGAQVLMLPQSRDIVVLGGYDQDRNPVAAAERYTLDINRLQPLEAVEDSMGAMQRVRAGAAIEPVSNGRILVAAGMDPAAGHHSDAEYFTPYDPVQ